MRARLVSLVGDDAQVLVTPSWLARLLGARPYVLLCRRCSHYWGQWRTAVTQREVPRVVLDVLDRMDVDELPTASVVQRRVAQ